MQVVVLICWLLGSNSNEIAVMVMCLGDPLEEEMLDVLLDERKRLRF